MYGWEAATHRQCSAVVLELVHNSVGHTDVLEHALQLRSELTAALRLYTTIAPAA